MLKLVNNSCFFEFVINSLHEALTELNITHEVVKNYNLDDNDNIYLICTTHHNIQLPKRYISYNLEQLTTDKTWEPIFFEKLSKAELILDFSLENINVLYKNNITAHFLPLGYSKNMENNYNDNNNSDRIIDFTFLGAMNDIRNAKIDLLINTYENKKDKLVISDSYWGDDLKKIYSKTKIGLNIHYCSGKKILEVVRIIPLIANKILVISEKSDDSWYDEKYGDLINFIESDKYSEECLNILHNYNADVVEKRYLDLVNNHKYVNYVKSIVHLLNI